MRRMTALLTASVAAVSLAARVFADQRDLDGDGRVNMADVQALLTMICGNGASEVPALDLDNNGRVDLRDALRFGQWRNGLWYDNEVGCSPLRLQTPSDEKAFQAYRTNLEARKHTWSAADLRARYPGAALIGAVSYPRDEVHFVTEAESLFTDPAYMNDVLAQGVSIYGKRGYANYHAALDAIHTADLPVIVTTDIILHAVYRSYGDILMTLETGLLSTNLKRVLVQALDYCGVVYETVPAAAPARDYLTTALCLLDPAHPAAARPNARVKGYLGAVEQGEARELDLFGRRKLVDFSQFKPRARYVETEELERYFRAMTWLSRVDLAFEIGGTGATHTMKRAAMVLWDCVVNSGAFAEWKEMNGLIEYLVGVSDGLSPLNMGFFMADLGVTDVPEAIASFDQAAFDATLDAGEYGMQMVMSDLRFFNGKTDSLPLPAIFSFMPQRFVLDAFTHSQTLYPLIGRFIPSSLDIAFVLGDNSALDGHGDLGIAGMPGILACQRELYDDLSDASWGSSLYSSWLGFLRTLNGAGRNARLSPVFRTDAWRRKMRNTQLASWAQLRSNTVLYAKQAAAGGACHHPTAYVEPYPAFFAAVGDYARRGAALFEQRAPDMAAYFGTVADICRSLEQAAQRTARGLEATPEQVAWLKKIVVSADGTMTGMYIVKVYDGWYFDLIYEAEPYRLAEGVPMAYTHEGEAFRVREADLMVTEEGASFEPFVEVSYPSIADVATKPRDNHGPAGVYHAATGFVNLMSVVVELDTSTVLFVGPVTPFHEFTTFADSARRIGPDQWRGALLATITKRPWEEPRQPWSAVRLEASELVTRPSWAQKVFFD